jgi:hypothetical protein
MFATQIAPFDSAPSTPTAHRHRHRPGTLWLVIGGVSTPRELTAAEEAELVEFIEACRASAPLPEPCVSCHRPASPYTDAPGGPVCWRCA